MQKIKSIVFIILNVIVITDAQKAHKFDAWVYKIECHEKRSVDELIEEIVSGSEPSRCEKYDTLIDSECVTIPYNEIFVNGNTIAFQNNFKDFNIVKEFYFDKLTSTYSPLKFKKAWSTCCDAFISDTIFQDTVSKDNGPYSEIRMTIRCHEHGGSVSIRQKGLNARLYDDTLEVMEQGWGYPVIKIPIQPLKKKKNSFYITGIPDSGIPHVLNGGLGFLDTIQIKNTYDGTKGSNVYIQKNHKNPIYDHFEGELSYLQRDGFSEYKKIIDKECTHKNQTGKIPLQWLRVFPFKNVLYLVYAYNMPYGGFYCLTDSSIIFSDIGRPNIQAYTFSSPSGINNSCSYILSNKTDTICQILLLDSLKTFSGIPTLFNKKFFVPASSIRDFDFIIQEGNCERHEKLTFEDIMVKDVVKMLKVNKIKYLLVAD